MLTGGIFGFVTWSLYLAIHLIVVAASRDKKIEPKKLLHRLAIAIVAGIIWGGIIKYAITGSPH